MSGSSATPRNADHISDDITSRTACPRTTAPTVPDGKLRNRGVKIAKAVPKIVDPVILPVQCHAAADEQAKQLATNRIDRLRPSKSAAAT